MYIEPAPQIALDAHVRNNCSALDSQIITQNDALLTLAGLGLVKFARCENGEFAWVRTKVLLALQKEANDPFEVTSFIIQAGCADESEIALAGSLDLIIDDIVVSEKLRLDGGVEVGSALRLLAGLGYAAISSRSDGAPIWIATPPLILYYEMGLGIPVLSAQRKQEIHIESAAAQAVSKFTKIAKKLYRGAEPEEIAVITGLLALEVADQIVPGLNEHGQLVWCAAAEGRPN